MAARANGRATSRRGSVTSISQRTLSRHIRAGLRRAREAGVRLGRPPARFDLDRAIRLHQRGWTIRDIARALGVAKSTLADRLPAAPE